jgi:hypothetical protein
MVKAFLFGAGHVEKVGNVADGDDEVIVRHVVGVADFGVPDANGFVGEVDALHVGVEEADVAEHFAEGVDDVGEVDVAGGDFVEHGSKENGIFTADEGDLDIGREAMVLSGSKAV